MALKAHYIIIPAHKANKSFLKPSQLPGEYTAQLLPFLAHREQTISAFTGTHLTPGWREAMLKDTDVTAGARTHTRTWVQCARPLGHDNPLYVHYTTHGTYGAIMAIMVKYLAQGHKCHDRGSNPHPAAGNTRVRCARPLGHDTPRHCALQTNVN